MSITEVTVTVLSFNRQHYTEVHLICLPTCSGFIGYRTNTAKARQKSTSHENDGEAGAYTVSRSEAQVLTEWSVERGPPQAVKL